MATCTRFKLLSILLLSLFVMTTQQELKAAAGASNAADNDEPNTDLFDRLDSNHDHMISMDEYRDGWSMIRRVVGAGASSSSSSASWSLFPTYHGGFWKGFTSGVAMILATEIGDKTFFIAAVLSMRQRRSAVFCGAILSLYVMTVLSAIMGLVLPAFIPVSYTHLFGGVLFLYFGVKLLNDSRSMEANQVSEELEEVEEELLHPKKQDDTNDDDVEVGGDSKLSSMNDPMYALLTASFVKVAMQSFSLTFLAEWGDRSQIATIALAAAKNPYGVTLGGCVGHTMCTGLAVLGGRMLAARISEKSVSLFGGIIFCLFGFHSVFFEE